MADEITTQTPLLPPEPWYTSAVQRAAVFGMIAGTLGLAAQLFEVSVAIEVINLKVGIIAQLANMGFALWGIIKRKSSSIQPLTLTRASADRKAEAAQLDPQSLQSKVAALRSGDDVN